MWPRSDLQKLLGIDLPIIQAPMASATTPALASAVSNAGALGSLGCAVLAADGVREQVAAVRAATNRAFNLNFFVHQPPAPDATAAARMRAQLKSYYDELGLGAVPEAQPVLSPFDGEMLDLLLDLRPPVVSFHFGLPEAQAVRRLKDIGCKIISSATTVAEARQLETGGADAVVAQGYEAGGHRGSFTDTPGTGMVGTMALVPQVVDAVRVPVIAAGGIADGRGIAAAFALGAAGVQIGTAFLACPEASVAPHHREALARASDEGTQLTRAFTGRPARALRNRFTTEMEAPGRDALAFPLQTSLTAPFRTLGSHPSAADFAAMWAGQAAALARAMPAGQLIETLVAEAAAAMR
jgi:nitronate monooxygenase